MNVLSPRHLKIANWVVLAILVAGGYLLKGREFALGVLAGGWWWSISIYCTAS